jgi:hypothetical protein
VVALSAFDSILEQKRIIIYKYSLYDDDDDDDNYPGSTVCIDFNHSRV